MSDPAKRGYIKRMHNIWNERNNAPQTKFVASLALCDRKRRDRKTTIP